MVRAKTSTAEKVETLIEIDQEYVESRKETKTDIIATMEMLHLSIILINVIIDNIPKTPFVIFTSTITRVSQVGTT